MKVGVAERIYSRILSSHDLRHNLLFRFSKVFEESRLF